MTDTKTAGAVRSCPGREGKDPMPDSDDLDRQLAELVLGGRSDHR